MSAIRHDGYAIRDLSFQLSLMVLGVNKYIETEAIWKKKRELYRSYFGEFERQLRPALLHLAVNFRSMDDEIKANPEMLRSLQSNYTHQPIAFSVPDGAELNLRDVANKIIHARESRWYEKGTSHMAQIKSLLALEDEHCILEVDGELRGQQWTIGVNLVALSEQFYEYAEVACEYCGA